MGDCLFCNIAEGKIPSDIIYQDDRVVAFRDIEPQAPVHFLIIPRKHISTLNDLQEEDADLAGYILLIAKKLAKESGIHECGYRVNINCNQDAGQAVFHIHYHVLGGRKFTWPPG